VNTADQRDLPPSCGGGGKTAL